MDDYLYPYKIEKLKELLVLLEQYVPGLHVEIDPTGVREDVGKDAPEPMVEFTIYYQGNIVNISYEYSVTILSGYMANTLSSCLADRMTPEVAAFIAAIRACPVT